MEPENKKRPESILGYQEYNNMIKTFEDQLMFWKSLMKPIIIQRKQVLELCGIGVDKNIYIQDLLVAVMLSYLANGGKIEDLKKHVTLKKKEPYFTL